MQTIKIRKKVMYFYSPVGALVIHILLVHIKLSNRGGDCYIAQRKIT
jgi:hypothetical protein